ncbi:MAG: hemerythrin domain-containing protein [Proteobacteria bacterium]|nr:hemerythrin domain-containing protein [Pseudomonadota bacterium]
MHDVTEAARQVTPHDPIEFMLAEHLNHRRMCKALERLAAMTEFDATPITAMVDYIRFDLTLHIIDEEEDFFPLLRTRCLQDDDIDAVLARLSTDHETDKALSAQVRDMLNACLILRKPPRVIDGAVEALMAFATNERRHLALENAVIIPIARRRFTAEDLKMLSRRLLARRRRLGGES